MKVRPTSDGTDIHWALTRGTDYLVVSIAPNDSTIRTDNLEPIGFEKHRFEVVDSTTPDEWISDDESGEDSEGWPWGMKRGNLERLAEGVPEMVDVSRKFLHSQGPEAPSLSKEEFRTMRMKGRGL